MRVLKFGGTSVQDASALLQVADAVRAQLKECNKLVVVLSATAGTTSALLDLIALSVKPSTRSSDIESAVAEIQSRHVNIATGLISDIVRQSYATEEVISLCSALQSLLLSINKLGECTRQTSDEIVSYGEQISTMIFEKGLEAMQFSTRLVDARTLIATDDNFQKARVLQEESAKRTSTVLNSSSAEITVTQGFIGSTLSGFTTTLGRGGSDYTAALLGAYVKAEEIRIYTDVSGVFSADPRIVSSAHPIVQLSFAEVREMALYGAKVLHPDTIAPAVELGIPVRVLNTFHPEDAGTVITERATETNRLHAVSRLVNCSLISGSSSVVHTAIRSGNLVHNVVLQVSGIERTSAVVQIDSETELHSVNLAAAGTDLEVSDVHVIALCGPTAGQPETLHDVMNVCRSYATNMVASGISDTISFVVCSPEQSTDLIRALHALTQP